MCGRYLLFTTTETLVTALSERLGEPVKALAGTWLEPSWNVAPTHRIAVVRRFGGALVLGPAQWGFPAPWRAGTVLFNARGETVFDKASFAGAEPALVVMDGWYEWHADGDHGKTPYRVSSETVLFAAGLVRPGESTGQGSDLRSTIVTSPSRPPVEWLHARMPRIMDGHEAVTWLGGDEDEVRDIAGRSPRDDVCDCLRTSRVHRSVGNVAINGPELLTDTIEE